MSEEVEVANDVGAPVTAIGTSVLALPTGPVLSNKYISRVIDIVKPHIRDLVRDSNLVRTFA